VRVAEEVWRLRRRLDRAFEQVGTDVLQGVNDSTSRLSTILSDYRVEVLDHAGESYDEGRRLTVLHVDGQPSDGQRLWIAETVSPTILFDGKILKEGQVMLSTRAPEARTP
jgi:hypothetical protein